MSVEWASGKNKVREERMLTWAEPEVAARHAATNIPTSRSGFTSSAFITLCQFKNVDECIRKSGKYHEYISVLVGSDYLP